MRPALVMVVVGLAGAAHAEDVRVTFLTKQLQAAQDARVKTQTVLLLGQTGSADAVPLLCTTLHDGDPIVRTAAASALGDLKLPAAVECLKKALGETDASVRGALQRALDAASAAQPQHVEQPVAVAPGGTGALYLAIDPVIDKVGALPEAVTLADKVLRDKLTLLGASFAPPNEDRTAAKERIRAKGMKGYQLKLQLLPGATEKALKVEMLILSYPDQALQGSWNVKASGGKPEALIKAMVPRVVDDAAGDLNWKH